MSSDEPQLRYVPSERVALSLASSPLCAKCEYDLEGLAPNAPCPECGGTARSQPSLLRRTPHWYLARLRLALNLLRFSVLVIGVGPFAYIAFGGYARGLVSVPTEALWACVVSLMIALGAGVYLLATPILPFVNYAIAEIPRRWLRPSAVTGFALIVVGSACLGLSPRGGPGGAELGSLGAPLAALGVLTLLIASLMAIEYGTWIAACVPDAALVKQGRVFLWLAPVIACLGLCFFSLGPAIAGILVFIFFTRVRRRVVVAMQAAAQ